MAEVIKQILAMGLFTWLIKKSLSEGACGQWGGWGLELMLLCRGGTLLLGTILEGVGG